MHKKIFGLDIGSNSLGWSVLSADYDKPTSIIDLGVRIFNKAVGEKTPIPKNVKRREGRLARRVIQRRARRKQRMLNYLINLQLLPLSLKDNHQPEIILNELGDPYQLRAKALDEPLTPHELGRVFLHLVQRRGFLSNKKILLGGEMLDDPDVLEVLAEEGEGLPENTVDKEESAFKTDINELRQSIAQAGYRTLGEYLASLDFHDCKRNRAREGGHLRTDREMYRDELEAIWQCQSKYHAMLTDEVRFNIEEIIFYQRPLKLSPGRIGRCSLEPRHKRCRIARLEYQKFRYLQDINNLKYLDHNTKREVSLSAEDREKLFQLFEHMPATTFAKVKTDLGLKRVEFNLEGHVKRLKGNTTACTIRESYPEWDNFSEDRQAELVEDLLSIRKKTALKKRLENHWGIDGKTPIKRVRVKQSSTTFAALEKNKFGVRNQQGDPFRWMAYGNMHHVEIIQDVRTGKHQCVFVTAMEAARRARSVNGNCTPIIQTNHGELFKFVMALHINDLVSVIFSGEKKFYRVQKLEQPRGLTLRLHTAATLDKKDEEIRKSINTLMSEYGMSKHHINAIGKLQNDKTHCRY